MVGSMTDEYSGRELEVLSVLPQYHRWIVECLAPYLRGRAAEIGAGTGTMTTQIRPRVAHLTAVEPAPNLLPVLKQRLAGTDVEIVDATGEGYLRDAGSDSLDTIVMINVLEHIEDDRAVLGGCRRVLRPGAHLLLFVPASPMLFSDLDRSFGHFRRYRRQELAAKLRGAGLTVDEIYYVDLLGAVAWWLIFRILRRTQISLGGARIYDRFVVPVTRAIERAVPIAFGKNLIAIAHA
jgi:SAM-dependent methyltransferase